MAKDLSKQLSTRVLNFKTCILFPSDPSFYGQITSHEKGGAVSGVGQW